MGTILSVSYWINNQTAGHYRDVSMHQIPILRTISEIKQSALTLERKLDRFRHRESISRADINQLLSFLELEVIASEDKLSTNSSLRSKTKSVITGVNNFFIEEMDDPAADTTEEVFKITLISLKNLSNYLDSLATNDPDSQYHLHFERADNILVSLDDLLNRYRERDRINKQEVLHPVDLAIQQSSALERMLSDIRRIKDIDTDELLKIVHELNAVLTTNRTSLELYMTEILTDSSGSGVETIGEIVAKSRRESLQLINLIDVQLNGRMKELESRVNRDLQNNYLFLIVMVVVSSIIALIGSFMLNRALSQPIARLTEVTNQIAQGNYNQRFEFNEGKQFEPITNSINDMASNLEENKRELDQRILELDTTSQFLKTIIDTAPIRVFWKDLNLCYMGCNPAFARDAGMENPEDLLGKDDFSMAWTEQADLYRNDERHIIETGVSQLGYEEPQTTSEGRQKWLSTSKVPLRDMNGSILGVLGIYQDITERKKTEELILGNSKILEMIATGKPASQIYDEIALMFEARHPGMRCSLLELHDGVLLHGGAPSMPKEYCDAVHGLKNGPNVGSCGVSTYTGERCVVENIETHPNWSTFKDAALPHGMRSCWSEPVKNSSGKVLGAFGMYYNYPALPTEKESEDLKAGSRLAGIVMERDQAQKRIRELAYTDELTNLASRVHLYENLEETIQSSKRHNSRFALLYIDLDDFKNINDSLGHDVGDLLLQTIGLRLTKVSREIDFIARLGGDEFCVIVKDVEDDYAAAYVAQRYLAAISVATELAGRKLKPNSSIGIAHYPDDGNDLQTLLKVSDTALYAAKELGKNQYAFYKPELTHRAEHRFQMEQALTEAIEKRQLSLVYQPQVYVCTGHVIGIEALSRWNHPELGYVPPDEFIATAERIGLIKPLTEWVLRTACEQAVVWNKENELQLRMAVNVSPSHFIDKDFISMIKRIIDETGINPSNLELEVTENVVQTDAENLTVFRKLKELGVMIAIDDFGTGYSSFASLKHLTADCLKIDRHFINDMLDDNETRLLVESMISIGHNLEQGIIAEGVETAEQLELLKNLGCETAQGYFFSKPIPAEEMSKFLCSQNINESDIQMPNNT